MELIVLKKEDIAREIAKEIVTLINRKNNACLGLATGSSPIGVYQELIKAYNNKFVPGSLKAICPFDPIPNI